MSIKNLEGDTYFSKPWPDEELYKKYKLTKEEIAYIEDNIDEMG